MERVTQGGRPFCLSDPSLPFGAGDGVGDLKRVEVWSDKLDDSIAELIAEAESLVGMKLGEDPLHANG
jgi:hypothetical protein